MPSPFSDACSRSVWIVRRRDIPPGRPILHRGAVEVCQGSLAGAASGRDTQRCRSKRRRWPGTPKTAMRPRGSGRGRTWVVARGVEFGRGGAGQRGRAGRWRTRRGRLAAIAERRCHGTTWHRSKREQDGSRFVRSERGRVPYEWKCTVSDEPASLLGTAHNSRRWKTSASSGGTTDPQNLRVCFRPVDEAPLACEAEQLKDVRVHP